MQKPSTQSGFTLIEIIVSLGVFSTVVTIAVGALLVLVASNQQLQDEQSVMTNLSFALDSMTREIRTGTGYYCLTANSDNNNVFPESGSVDSEFELDDSRDCGETMPQSHRFRGLSFVESGDSVSGATNERILYYYNSDTDMIYRKIGNEGAMPITSTSSGAVINDFRFWVTGSRTLEQGGSGSEEQPVVTIYIDASDARNPDKHFNIQTTVTQRTLDL